MILNDKELVGDKLNQYFFGLLMLGVGMNIGNSSELLKTVKKILNCKENHSSIFEFDRIASWSKVLTQISYRLCHI